MRDGHGLEFKVPLSAVKGAGTAIPEPRPGQQASEKWRINAQDSPFILPRWALPGQFAFSLAHAARKSLKTQGYTPFRASQNESALPNL